VLLWEHPDFAQTIAPIRETRTIHLEGTARTGAAKLAGVTVDPAAALAWSETLVCSVPAYAHAPFIEQLAPHLRPGHVLALLPGNLGTLPFAKALREAGATGVILAEADTAPYVCRRIGPDRAVIWGTVSSLGLGVFPASQTAEAMPALQRLFPGAKSYAHVLEAGLSAMNPVVHPPGVLLNAGRIERSRGEFWFYEEGVTPSVVRAIEALDAERLAIGRAFGLTMTPVAEAFHAAGFGPAGDLWSTINGSAMLTALRAPGSMSTRWLTEDVPYGFGDVGGPRPSDRSTDASHRRRHHARLGGARDGLPGDGTIVRRWSGADRPEP
jgi:opine dehydrogenase